MSHPTTEELLRDEIRFAHHCERKYGKSHPETVRAKAKADVAYFRLSLAYFRLFPGDTPGYTNAGVMSWRR